jgi:dTDP-4-amino-4,6-dideoxygalactose transaminase
VVSTVEVYGSTAGQLREDSEISLPLDDAAIEQWLADVTRCADQPIYGRSVALCHELLAADPTGRWVYALAKRAQELLFIATVPSDRLTILRLANVFGPGQRRVVARLVTRARAGLPLTVTNTVRGFASLGEVAHAIRDAVTGELPAGIRNIGTRHLNLPKLADLVLEQLNVQVPVRLQNAPDPDSSGLVTSMHPPSPWSIEHHLLEELRQYIQLLAGGPTSLPATVPVVIPPKPFRPDVVADRQADAIWSGRLKHGNRWTTELTDRLTVRLALPSDSELILTSSGSAALRLAIAAAAPPRRDGDVAVLPSYTFPATAEVLLQLGYELRFCDVDRATWTMSAHSLADTLDTGRAAVVVAVDSLGNPADYDALRAVCAAASVAFVADSAPSLGATYGGHPVGTQADAHAFSMSFAKVVSAAGAGGAAVVPRDRAGELMKGPTWLRSSLMPEISAIVALDLVERLDDLVAARTEVADCYAERLGRRSDVRRQQVTTQGTHAWVHWVFGCPGQLPSGQPRRDAVQRRLAELCVDTKPYYTPLAEDRAPLAPDRAACECPVSVELEREALALPMSSELSTEDAEAIAEIVDYALEECGGA